MKLASEAIFLALAMAIAMASAHSQPAVQSPREQFQALVAQLQKAPADNALRERVIRLGADIKPKPAIPEEANRHEGRGKFAFRNAKSRDDFIAAAAEFEAAVNSAPWVAGYYSDLCTIYEKAEKYPEAKRNCEFYLSSLADDAQASEVRQRIAGIEFGIEKASSPQAREAARRAEEDRFLASLEGVIFDCGEHRDERWHVNRWTEVKGGQLRHWQHVLWAAQGRGYSHLPLTPVLLGADPIKGKSTRLENRTVILEQNKVTTTADTGPFAGRPFVCNRR